MIAMAATGVWRSQELGRAERTVENQIALITLMHQTGMDIRQAVADLGKIHQLNPQSQGSSIFPSLTGAMSDAVSDDGGLVESRNRSAHGRRAP